MSSVLTEYALRLEEALRKAEENGKTFEVALCEELPSLDEGFALAVKQFFGEAHNMEMKEQMFLEPDLKGLKDYENWLNGN